MTIRFSDADGLALSPGRTPISIRSPSGGWIPPADVQVARDRSVLTGSFPAGSTIRFAWSSYYEVNLTNAAGIPATPFQIEVPEPTAIGGRSL